jgi:chloramphenicol-sensitive protein RarD
VPWISLVLAASFASYGYLKKLVPFGPTESLTVETAFLAPIAIVIFAVLGANGTAAFGSAGWSNTVLLILTGPVTTVPLLLFAASARRIPLTLLGLLQYLTPVGQFLCGVLVFHEQLSTARWIGFGLVWAALVILTTDAFRDTRRPALAPVEVG